MTRDDRIQFLRQLPAFDELSEADLIALAQRVTRPKLPRGTVLAREGELAESAYLLLSGIVHQTRTRPLPDERLSAFLTGGELVADRSLRTGQPETASAVAFTEVELYALARRDFEEAMRERPALAISLVRALGARLDRSGLAAPAPEMPRSARIVPLVAMNAGTGRTTLGMNLCAAIADLTGGRVLFLDPSLTGRGISRALGISSDADYVEQLLRGDALDVKRVTWRTKGGFYTALPPRLRGVSLAEPHLTAAFHTLCAAFDFVVVDSSSVMANVNRAVLRAAERVLLVASAGDQLDDDRAQFQRSILAGAAVRPERLVCAVNQVRSGASSTAANAVLVPHSAELLEKCAADKTIAYQEAPESPFAVAVRELALRLVFDHRLRVALPQPWPSSLGPEEAAGRLHDFLKGRFAQVAHAGDTAVQAWATQPVLSRHLAETMDFLGAMKGELALPYLCLEINGKPNLI